MTEKEIADALDRARALLASSGEPLADAAPHKPAGDIGALDALGYTVQDPDVAVSVYVIPMQKDHPAAWNNLKNDYEKEGVRVLFGSNGPLMFFGHTQIDGADSINAKFRLSGLAQAFAGEE